ncbi:BTAD domain-containing putative transcriptional regulator [Kitasatospora sp. LaBMicrA B282]|uniref:AfsR/SARP family transcriptional regulator n=1 Tax=Kitasatospora sp. LaBMicrA B282 TaxID=3420949 RepID=UPI003D0F4CC2
MPIAAAKQRILIAVLALAAGGPVTVERLIACLWGDEPPLTARNTLQNYVLRLRRTLQVDAEPVPLVSSVAGYRLDVRADAVDLNRFRSLVRSAAAAGEPESAAALLEEALELWRGEPLADVPSEVLHREVVPGLVEQRLAALEQRIDLDLDLGRHRELITELAALTTEHRLRERLWAQLMLALFRSGRAAEALDAYRRVRGALAEELGIDPGPELQRLHQAVLTNDPTLTITGPTPGPSWQRASAPRVVPRQLPPSSAHFVGRATQVRRLDAQWEAAAGAPLMVISAIGGTAGIGKTALALYWAHLHADQFPDGQLYVNLRGFDPTGAPLPPMTALRGFLTALGVPAQAMSADPDEQVSLYRSHLAGRRMLVVLDNARDAEQVRPLLPGAPGCLVLVTSRDQLAGLVALDGAVPLTLDLLTRDEAHDLLIRRLGRDRVAREQADVDELIEWCVRLPLALNIAARATLQVNRPLAGFLDELRDTHRRLDALSTGEAAADVRVVFSWSYRTLTPESARVFRLLGMYPGPDISLSAAAGLAGHDPDTTRHALDELSRAHLITEHSPGRYSLHDLLRAYAAEQAQVHDDDVERQAALRRVVDFYAHTADAAHRFLDPHRPPVLPLPAPAPGSRPHPLPDHAVALAWFDAEHACLLAAQHIATACGWHRAVWVLAWALDAFHHRRGHRHDQLAVWRAGLTAAEYLPDPTARARAHVFLGDACTNLGRHEEAIEHLHQALALAEHHPDLTAQARAQHSLALAWGQQGDDGRALLHAAHALPLYRALDNPVWEANALNLVGWYAARLGEYERAREHCQASLALRHRHHDPQGEANTLDSLGYIDHHTGHRDQAIVSYRQAVALYRDLGHTYSVADALDGLGHPHAALGQHDQARTVWREALELYRQQGRDQAVDRVLRQLEALDLSPPAER